MKFNKWFNTWTVLGIMCLSYAIYCDITKEGEKKPPDQSATNVFIPEYEVIDEEEYDASEKAQITLRILVNQSSEITEENLKNLLNKIYLSLKDRKNFTYYGSPTHIFIYAYTSKEKSGSDWIAMLEKIGDGSEPEIKINELQLSLPGS